MISLISLLLAVALGANANPHGAKDGVLPYAGPLESFAVEIASNAARLDTRYAAFHGCVDWHSAVHAHWALFRLARLKIRPGLARAADSRLTRESVGAERELLERNPGFEMPYGRAWFLRLAMERSAWARETGAAEPDLLTPLADDVAATLLDHFERYRPTPFAGEYSNPSWALAQLRAYLATRDSPRKLARADKLIDGMLAAGSAGYDADSSLPEFFSIYGNWAYLIATARPASLPEFLARRPQEDDWLEPLLRHPPYPHAPDPQPEPSAHSLGLNWSRAWSLKAVGRALGAKDGERFARAYEKHVEQGLEERKASGKHYMRYGHWVPQFAVYAITDGELPAP